MSLALSSVVSIKPLFSVTKPVALSSQSTFFQGCDCVIISRRRRRRRRRPSWISLAGTLPSLGWNLGKIFDFLSSSASWDPWTNQNQPHPQKKRNWWRRKRRYSLLTVWNKVTIELLFSQEYEAKLEERQKAEKLKFRSKIEEKINAFLKDDKSKTLKFPAMDKFQRWVAFGLLNGVVLCMMMKHHKALLQVCCAWCIRNSWSCNSQFWGGRHWQTHPGLEFNSWDKNMYEKFKWRYGRKNSVHVRESWQPWEGERSGTR